MTQETIGALRESEKAGYWHDGGEFTMDPLFWYFLGRSRNWGTGIWKLRRSEYFHLVDRPYAQAAFISKA